MKQVSEFAVTIERAREESKLLGHAFVGPEHLLLGLLGNRDSLAAKFLREYKLSLSKLRQEVVVQIGKGDGSIAQEVPPPSLRSLGAIRLAQESARIEGIEVDSLSLLWALLHDRESDACQLLARLGVNLSAWAAAIEERIGGHTRRRPVTYLQKGSGKRTFQAEMRFWKDRMLEAKEHLNQQIVGQSAAVDRVMATLTRAWAGLAEARKPLASFLFLGPRGSGKATLARLLAALLYGDEERLLRIDMGEFAGDNGVERLIGSQEQPFGILTSLALEYPYSILLLENIERAHFQVVAKVAQILGSGYATDGQGQRVSFRDHVIVLSVGVASDQLEREHPVGFRIATRAERDIGKMESELLPELDEKFGSEITEKVDEIVIFAPLEAPEYRRLIARWSRELEDKLWQRRSLKVSLPPCIGEVILEDNHSTPDALRRSFLRLVENMIASQMLKGSLRSGESYTVYQEGDRFALKKLD